MALGFDANTTPPRNFQFSGGRAKLQEGPGEKLIETASYPLPRDTGSQMGRRGGGKEKRGLSTGR